MRPAADKAIARMLSVLADGHVAVLVPVHGHNGAMTNAYRYARPEVTNGVLTGLTRDARTRQHDTDRPFAHGPHNLPQPTENIVEGVRWISRHAMQDMVANPLVMAMAHRLAGVRIETGAIAMDMLRDVRSREEIEEAADDLATRLARRSSYEGTKARLIHGLVEGLVLERRDVLDRGTTHSLWRLRRPFTDAAGRIVELRRDGLVRSLLAGWHEREYIPASEVDYLRPALVGVPDHPRLLALAPPARDRMSAFLRESPLRLPTEDGRQRRIADMLQGLPVEATGEPPSYEEIATVILSERRRDDAQTDAERRAEDMIVAAMRMAATAAVAREERRKADRQLPVPIPARTTLRERLRRALA